MLLALAATATPALAQVNAEALPVTITFDTPNAFNHNFFTTTKDKFTVNPTTGVVTAGGGNVGRTAIYSPGNDAAPTSFKNDLNAFYNGSISTTFNMAMSFQQGPATIHTIARVQDNGFAIVGLTTINRSTAGSVKFSFGVINLNHNSAISNYFGTGGTTGQTMSWNGSAAQVPAGTKLKVVMEAQGKSFQLSLQAIDGTVLAASGWQEMDEAIAADFNKIGGVGFRTSWNTYTTNPYTIHQFDFTPAPVVP